MCINFLFYYQLPFLKAYFLKLKIQFKDKKITAIFGVKLKLL